jgi:hypothetical protein
VGVFLDATVNPFGIPGDERVLQGT